MGNSNDVCRWCCMITLLVLDAFCVINNRVTVNTKLGRVIGTIEMIGLDDGHETKSFYAFKGVPFARPPIGDLRWNNPLPYEKWPDVLNATTFGSSCPQFDRHSHSVVGNEDCLYLNIYTTSLPRTILDLVQNQNQNQEKPLLPVLVWFHGGGYIRGGSQQFGPQFFMREDVVLVTVNYRLGVLGFLSTGDAYLPGNYGMLDQIESLKWIKAHISNFGGDPDRVTIFGESAGGAITHLLTLSPLARGLFKQAIIQSASALCDWSIELNPAEYASIIANGLQCPSESEKLVSCLKKKSSKELIEQQTQQLRFSLFPVRCAPVLDGSSRIDPFLPEQPQEIIKHQRYKPVPMIIGLNPNEGIHYENMAKMSNATYLQHELFPGVVSSLLKKNDDATIKIVKEQYFADSDFAASKSFVPKFSQVIDDASFTSCVYAAQVAHSKTAPLYAYLFSYRGENIPSYSSSFGDLVRASGFDHPMINKGVTHADELLYLFRMTGFPYSKLESNDLKISKLMTGLWSNFAKTGDPVQGSTNLEETLVWPRVSPITSEIVYLKIDANIDVGADFRLSEHNFWMNVLPTVRHWNLTTTICAEGQKRLTIIWTLLGVLGIVFFLLTFVVIFQRRFKTFHLREIFQRESGEVVLQRCS